MKMLLKRHLGTIGSWSSKFKCKEIKFCSNMRTNAESILNWNKLVISYRISTKGSNRESTGTSRKSRRSSCRSKSYSNKSRAYCLKINECSQSGLKKSNVFPSRYSIWKSRMTNWKMTTHLYRNKTLNYNRKLPTNLNKSISIWKSS